ncbi:MAG TPA: ADP-ribosylglycohydrolase family protein [Spirochaetota bacterium]|nr:ADP-ribosylglycohydrolase family protein [Spirochaetota bacterium]HNT10104.1 ADP-ribosylglycohydrolase family protein [Spirochaetota bacterium]
MNNSKNILLGALIGNALGCPLDGLRKGHIGATLKNIHGYVDPLPALKGKEHRWKKPGLYDSIGQLMLLMALSNSPRRGFAQDSFLQLVRSGMDLVEGGQGIFRHPGPMELHLMSRIAAMPEGPPHPIASARLSAIAAPALAIGARSRDELFISAIAAGTLFTSDSHSLGGAALCALTLYAQLEDDAAGEDAMDIAAREGRWLIDAAARHSADLFDAKLNPDSFAASCETIASLFAELAGVDDPAAAEHAICARADHANPATRATVDHPLYALPYAMFVAGRGTGGDGERLIRLMREGGATSAMCAIAGACTGARTRDDAFLDDLTDGLVNRKRVLALLDRLALGRGAPGMDDDFLLSEKALTLKEREELSARTRHAPVKERKTKRPKDGVTELSRHVVESWTKIDKARWQRQKKRLPDPGG